MGNIFKIKRGSGVPTPSQLSPYELGFDTTGRKLYINDNGEIIKAGGGGGFVAQATAPTDHDMLWIDTSGAAPVTKYYDGTDWVNIGIAVFG